MKNERDVAPRHPVGAVPEFVFIQVEEKKRKEKYGTLL